MQMKHILKGCSLVLSMLMAASLLPAVSAETPEPVNIDGVPTVFISSFGKMSYGGTSYSACRSLEEGLTALSETGGAVLFNGSVTLEQSSIGAGESLRFTGAGNTVTSSVLVAGESELTAVSDLSFSNLSFRFPEGNRLVMNGHNFTAGADTDVYYEITDHTTGARRYAPAVNLYSGNASEEYAFTIDGGTYGVIASGAGTVKASSRITLTGASVETLYIGSLEGQVTGSTDVYLTDTQVDEIVIGARDGEMTGDISLTLKGGSVNKISVGAYGDASSFDGHVKISADGTAIGAIGGAGDGQMKGSVVYFLSETGDTTLDENAAYQQLIRLSGGSAEPVYTDGKLSGVSCYDSYGGAAQTLLLADGTSLAADENGVFALTDGRYDATIVSALELGLREEASFVAGYTDGSFRPGGNMTRAEAVALLTRILANENAVKNGHFHSVYTDLSQDAWYYNYISFFENAGLLKKVTTYGGDANPNAPITRGEFCQLIYNIQTLLDPDVTYTEFAKLCHNVSSHMDNARLYDEFSDVNYNHPHNNAIYFALANGYAVGYADGTFRPDGSISRAEVVTVVNRFLGRNPIEGGENPFSDIDGSWAKSQILAATNPVGIGWTRSGDLRTAANGETLPAYVKTLMNDTSSDLVTAIANHVYKTAAESLAAPDISSEEKTQLQMVLEELKQKRVKGGVKAYTGSPDNLDTYIYGYVGSPYIRETVIEGRKPGTDPVEIVQITDTHFNLVNAYDIGENNPSVMSTKIYRTWLANGASQGNALRAMAYARYADQTVVTGDILDYLSYGCKELTVKNLFRMDTDLLACLGGHDTTRVMQGKVPDPTSYDSRLEWLRAFWPHDIHYTSKVIKDKVMCVVMDNGASRYWEEQIPQLTADIETARKEGYVILIFQHEPLCTRNPEDDNVPPLLLSASDGNGSDFGDYGIGKEGTSGASLEVYNLITQNADVIRGIFCGHYHGDYKTEILASRPDGNGGTEEAVIPQYVLTANAYGTGHVMKITVK